MKIPKGIQYILYATLAFGFMNALVKEVGDYNVFQIIFFRALGTFLICFILLKRLSIAILGKNRKWLMIRALTGVLSIISFFYVLQRIPFGSTMALRYTSPIFAAIFAVIFLKEKIYPLQWICFLTALTGVFLVKGFDARVDTWSLLLIIFSAIMTGIVYVIIRFLGDREHPLVIIIYFMGLATFVGLIFGLPGWKQPEGVDWIYFLLISLFGFIGQWYMTRAFQVEEANIIAPFKYMEVVYALVIGYFIFGESYRYFALLGIALVVIGMVGNVFAKKYIYDENT